VKISNGRLERSRIIALLAAFVLISSISMMSDRAVSTSTGTNTAYGATVHSFIEHMRAVNTNTTRRGLVFLSPARFSRFSRLTKYELILLKRVKIVLILVWVILVSSDLVTQYLKFSKKKKLFKDVKMYLNNRQ
jgi:hypothetical protein